MNNDINNVLIYWLANESNHWSATVVCVCVCVGGGGGWGGWGGGGGGGGGGERISYCQ